MYNYVLDISKFVVEHPELKVQNLARYLSKENLELAFTNIKANKASGIDEISKEEYGNNLEDNIEELHKRLVNMSYKPKPSKRVYIPKDGSNKMRPLGIPSIEDKIVQSVIADILEKIYEPIFIKESYGFRPKRSCHDAIKYLREAIIFKKTNYIVDADIRGFFDNINHEKMIELLKLRIDDKRFIALIERFLKAGIMEEGSYYETDKGSPQGGIISPILANIYLHYVQDMWIQMVVKLRARGEVYYVRYADDSIVCFQYYDEAKAYFEGLKKRLAKYGLEIAEEKTKILEFGRFAEERIQKANKGKKPSTFNFLGFTFYCSKTATNGKFTVKLKASSKKLKAKKHKMSKWIAIHRHNPIKWIIGKLNKSLRGLYQYYCVSDGLYPMQSFRMHTIRMLCKKLRSRGNRHPLSWSRFLKIIDYVPILKPKVYVKLW